MFWISKGIHKVSRFRRRLLYLLAALGPGIITMIADNDAGGISTYAQTGARTGFSLLWAFIILVPMAYYVQEMTVRLGAVTKRGHAEAIFDGFGKFWGWFSIFDLAVINFLTLVTEYIGMTQALQTFQHPRMVHVPGRHGRAHGHRDHRQVLDVRETHALFLPLQPGVHPRRHLGHADRQRQRRLVGGRQGLLAQ